MTPKPRRAKEEGGLGQRHDHPTCPPPVGGKRPKHTCKGRHYGKLTVTIAGKKRVKYVYGRTQKEARIKLETAKQQKREGKLVISSRTLEWWLTHWLDHIAKRRVKPQTLAGYRSKVSTLIVPHLGQHRLDQLQPEHIREWHDLLRERGGVQGDGLTEASVRQAHAILRKALTDAMRERKLPYNPADNVDSPGTFTNDRDRLTIQQAKVALTAAGDDPRWWLAIFCGMRQGECLGLRWGDVDLEAGTLTIAQTLQMDGGQVVFGSPKTKGSARVLPLPGQVSVRLRLKRPADVQPDQLVFATDTGEPVKPWVDNRAWHDFLDAAKLPSVALHSARNTAAGVLEDAGVPDRLSAQILGHSSVTQTHRYTRGELEQMMAAFTAAAGTLALEA